MCTTRQRHDFVLLDGDHSARTVYQEISAALFLLRNRGVILLHDYYPGVKALYPHGATIGGPYHALERIRREDPAVEVLPLGDLPWLTKQGKRATSLAMAARTPKSPSRSPQQTLTSRL